MRIGILTFHYVTNYGAVLQTYATCKLLQSLGHEVEVIDYENIKVKSGYKSWFLHKKDFLSNPLSYMFWYIPKGISRMLRKKNFSSFHLPVYHASLIELSERYDYIFIGSDQVWNTEITGGLDNYYWGNFKSRAKKIGWALSSNSLDITKEQQQYLQNFDAISVREESLLKILEPIYNKKLCLLSDPCLMLEKSEWEAITPKINRKQSYVLAYPMLYEDEVIKKARKIAEKRGLELIVIRKNAGFIPQKNYFQTKSPSEFLGFIAGADIVVTSSFHGLVFSLIFEKEYEVVTAYNNRNLRIENLIANINNITKFRGMAKEFLKDNL